MLGFRAASSQNQSLTQGGITVDPHKLSERELEKLTRKLVVAIKVG